ncbi:MAG: HNH endonuclease [Chitinophagaceae bacterium]|nr:HNH endonuclease [Chitinophagaceae bacterium]
MNSDLFNYFRPSAKTILEKSPTDWVWHHDINTGIMQLVPKHSTLQVVYFGIQCTQEV